MENKLPNESRVPTVHLADTKDKVSLCWLAFKELRPHIESITEFVSRWEQQRAEGYCIAYVESNGPVVAAAGFRIMNTMAWGKILYLDDLVAISSHHSRGYGSILLSWLKKKAHEDGCSAVHLDTGYHRFAAHRSYLRNGFQLTCHHLAYELKTP